VCGVLGKDEMKQSGGWYIRKRTDAAGRPEYLGERWVEDHHFAKAYPTKAAAKADCPPDATVVRISG